MEQRALQINKRFMRHLFWIVYLLPSLLLYHESKAQISPPGMGKAHTAEWVALGLRQKLNSTGTWQSMSYVGVGRKSNPDNYNPVLKPAIVVFNQEFFHQFHSKWQYSLALSYRRQDEYSNKPPFEHSLPGIKQEFRGYGRVSRTFKKNRFSFIPTYRQEFRKFYAPDFANSSENYQFRSRFRLQMAIQLDPRKIHRLIAGSEQLFSISKKNTPNVWSHFAYQESRFSLYYALAPEASPFVFSLGYMYNPVAHSSPHSVQYLAFDVVVQNPFRRSSKGRHHTHI